jgi:hypothetical protein
MAGSKRMGEKLILTMLALAVALTAVERAIALPSGPTIEERLVRLRSERTALQARADGEARLGLLSPLLIAGLLTDALSLRESLDAGRRIEDLAEPRRRAFVALAALNDALKVALDRPGDGARATARQVADRAAKSLEDLAATDDQPLVLQFSPRFVPPRRAGGDLTVAPREPVVPVDRGKLRLPSAPPRLSGVPQPVVPRYAPSFVTAAEEDPPVEIEIIGLRLATADGPPTLAVGRWRGEATRSPERLHFSVPRSAFETDATRSSFATAVLAMRRGGRLVTFELPFLVLPDRPGSVALDQKVRSTVPEANTLMSPEIMVRAPPGETRSVRRCFDPPAGWRFDKEHRRVVIVERLGWLDDVNDPTLNGGSVEFASDERADQVCVLVSAQPATKGARTATIGRFEATLVREQPLERVTRSGIRALDWHEAVRLPLESDAAERKLYVRLFGEIDRELDEAGPGDLPFLRLVRDGDVLVLRADPAER